MGSVSKHKHDNYKERSFQEHGLEDLSINLTISKGNILPVENQTEPVFNNIHLRQQQTLTICGHGWLTFNPCLVELNTDLKQWR